MPSIRLILDASPLTHPGCSPFDLSWMPPLRLSLDGSYSTYLGYFFFDLSWILSRRLILDCPPLTYPGLFSFDLFWMFTGPQPESLTSTCPPPPPTFCITLEPAHPLRLILDGSNLTYPGWSPPQPLPLQAPTHRLRPPHHSPL